MSTSPSVVDVNDENTLQRGLTSAQVSMIGLSGALGTGLFLGSGSMIGVAGPGVILSYTLTGLQSRVIVWCLAEMTVLHPVAGGFGGSRDAIDAQGQLGRLAFSAGDNAQALDLLQQAYDARPDPEIGAHLGEVLWQLGQKDKARAIWQKAIERAPHDAMVQAVLRKYGVTF